MNVGGIASSRSEFEEATLLNSDLMSHDEIDELRPRVYEAIAADTTDQRWIKVHDAYTLTRAGDPFLDAICHALAVYLVRDPRDVADIARLSHTTRPSMTRSSS